MVASVPSSPCWSTPRRSWGSATWWLAWISSIMTTRTSSATSSSLDSSLLLQGTSFNLLTQMLFVSSTPSELEQNLRDFPKLTDFCPNFSPSGQNLNFNLTNRLFNTLVSKQRIYGNIPQKWKKIQTKYLSVRSNKLKILVYMILIGKILRNNLIHLKH